MCLFLVKYIFLIVLQCVTTSSFSFLFHVSLHIIKNINYGMLLSSISKIANVFHVALKSYKIIELCPCFWNNLGGRGTCNISILLKMATRWLFSHSGWKEIPMCHSWTEILFSKQLQFPSVHSESLSIHPHNLSALFFIQLFLCVYISPSGYPYAPWYLHLPFHGANFLPAEHPPKTWRQIM